MKTIRSQRVKRTKSRLYVLLVGGAAVALLAAQLVMLYNKSEEYALREASLTEQLQEQKDRQKELSDYEQYTKTEEYTRNMAKSKLGLVSPNEIIFREKR